MDTAWIAPAVLGATQLLTAYLSKKSTDDNRAEIRMLKNMQAETQQEQSRLKSTIKDNEDGHNFRKNLYNAINLTAATKIIESESINENIELENALISYFSKMPEFAQTFFYCDLRKNDKIPKEFLKNFISINLSAEFSKLDKFIEKKITIEKCIISGTNKSPISFKDYIKQKLIKLPTIYDYNELLINRLADNGIDENELIKIFVTYTDNFLNEFKRKWRNFNKLKDFDVELDCKY